MNYKFQYSEPSLGDLLSKFEDEGKELYWCISNLWVIEKRLEGVGTHELECSVRDSKFGILVQWDDLVELTQTYDSVINFSAIGFKDKKDIDSFITTGKFEVEKDEIYINIDDGSCRGIKAKDKKIVKKINDSFGPFPFFVR